MVSLKSPALSVNSPKKRLVSVVSDPELCSFDHSSPGPLDLFRIHPDVERHHYTRLFDFWSSLPLFYYGKQRRFSVPDANLEVLPVLERFFCFNDRKFRLEIHPARIRVKRYKKGSPPREVDREFYPGLREELVQDALVRMATENGCCLSQPEKAPAASVVFSIYALRKELQRVGHYFSPLELRQAIEICRRTTVVISSLEGECYFDTSFYGAMGLQGSRRPRCFVTFNPLIDRAIMRGEWRLVNYEKCMKFRRCLARWLYKRMTNRFIQAAPNTTYGFWLSTILRECGATTYGQFRVHIWNFELALRELEDLEIILPTWPQEKTIKRDDKDPRKIADVKYQLRATHAFQQDMIRANFLRKRVQVRLKQLAR